MPTLPSYSDLDLSKLTNAKKQELALNYLDGLREIEKAMIAFIPSLISSLNSPGMVHLKEVIQEQESAIAQYQKSGSESDEHQLNGIVCNLSYEYTKSNDHKLSFQNAKSKEHHQAQKELIFSNGGSTALPLSSMQLDSDKNVKSGTAPSNR